MLAPVTPTTKPWVYKRLVRDDADLVGLLAYGLYKKRKTEIAEELRNQGKEEQAIENELAHFHDQVVTGDVEIQRYRNDGHALLDVVIKNAQKEAHEQCAARLAQMQDEHTKAIAALESNHNKKIQDANKAHQKAIQEAKKSAIDTLAKTAKSAQEENKSRTWRFFVWLFSGVPGTAATFFLTIIMLGLFAFFAPSSMKDQITGWAAKTLLNVDIPAKPANP